MGAQILHNLTQCGGGCVSGRFLRIIEPIQLRQSVANLIINNYVICSTTFLKTSYVSPGKYPHGASLLAGDFLRLLHAAKCCACKVHGFIWRLSVEKVLDHRIWNYCSERAKFTKSLLFIFSTLF